MPPCSKCSSPRTIKNIHTGKQRFQCCNYGYQFVEHPTDKRIDHMTRELVDRLLLEHFSMAFIAQVLQVSQQWLQDYINLKAGLTKRHVQVRPQKRDL